MEIGCSQPAEFVLIGHLVRDVAKRGAQPVVSPAEYELRCAKREEFGASAPINFGIILQRLHLAADQVVEPYGNRRWIDLGALSLEPAVNVVVGLSLDGLQVELAGDFHDGLR